MKFSCLFLCVAVHAQIIVNLNPESVREFEGYQVMVDRELSERTHGQRPFLWIDEHPEDKRKAAGGEIVTLPLTGGGGRNVTDGLVHDWVGAMYLRGLKLDAVTRFLLDTEHHARVYPEVTRSSVLSRSANQKVTRLRIEKEKVFTVVLDIDYDNQWEELPPGRWTMSARSRNVTEIDQGKSLPPGRGHGFLWAMNSQWSLREDAGGVWVELRTVSLSRDAPRGVGWLVRPVIRGFPGEAIASTMQATRTAVTSPLRDRR